MIQKFPSSYGRVRDNLYLMNPLLLTLEVIQIFHILIDLPGLDRISNLIRFSIVAKAKLSENPNGIATITSHSSCGCWVL